MNKKLLKILIFLFTFVALMLNATFSSATSESDSEKRINVSGIVCNPVFGEQTEIQAQTFLSSSVSEYSEQEYSDDIEDIITDIREGMENRDESITVYLYIELDDEIETSQDVDVGWNDVINILLEEVFKETNVATQGDYLRYNWSQCAYMISWATTGDVYYFDITFDFTYYTTKEQEDELTLEINKLIESFEFDANTTDREKVDTIYD